MNKQIERLIDRIDFSSLRGIALTKNKPSLYSLPSKNSSLTSGSARVLKNQNQCQSLLEKINCQAKNYVQSLKKFRSEINSLLRQYEHNLDRINEHPLYLLFQIESASQLPNLLADKLFIDSLSEKISEDTPPQDLAKSIAINIESQPILSSEDLNEKLVKTTLLKMMIGFINQGDTATHRCLVMAAQTGQLNGFIKKLVKKEGQLMRVLQADAQSLQNDNLMLKQVKRNVNQQIRQIRKQLKAICQLHPHDTRIDLIQRSGKISESIRQSQNLLYAVLSDICLELKGSVELVGQFCLFDT